MSNYNITNLNHKINEAFTGTFDSEKIEINFIPNTFYSDNCNLTKREIIILKSGGDNTEIKKKYFDMARKGYEQIIKMVNIAKDIIPVIRLHKFETETDLLSAEQGLNDILGNVLFRQELLEELRNEILESE